MRITPDLSGNGMGAGFVQQAYLEETLTTSNRESESVRVVGNFNASTRGTWTGTIKLRRSLDNGANWMDLTAGGSSISYTANLDESFYEPEPQALYRWEFTTFGSGSVIVRIGK